MAAANVDYYKIGGLIIPLRYRPDYCPGVEPPQGDGETNLLAEKTGARGGGTCVLVWEVCPQDVYTWWYTTSDIIPRDQLSVPVTEVILPDPTGRGDPVENYPGHGRYNYAVVHRIERLGRPRRWWGSTKGGTQPYFIEGTVQVEITMIGEVPPV